MSDAIPTKHFVRNALTGGTTGCLDAINGSLLEEGYTCSVTISAGVKYDYRLNATSGAAESSPTVISPDTNAGNKRWILRHLCLISIADATLSGVPKIFTIYDGATPYYVKAYPTKV